MIDKTYPAGYLSSLNADLISRFPQFEIVFHPVT